MTITDVLNLWAQQGVFSYVIPFLLMFAVVFAILEKTKLLGQQKAIDAIVAMAIGLLALQFDFVSTFYAEIFPKFGVGIAIFLVVIILIGFFYHDDAGKAGSAVKWVGWFTGIGVVIWALTSWNFWGDNFSIGWWFYEYFWSLIILAAIIGVIVWATHSSNGGTVKS